MLNFETIPYFTVQAILTLYALWSGPIGGFCWKNPGFSLLGVIAITLLTTPLTSFLLHLKHSCNLIPILWFYLLSYQGLWESPLLSMQGSWAGEWLWKGLESKVSCNESILHGGSLSEAGTLGWCYGMLWGTSGGGSGQTLKRERLCLCIIGREGYLRRAIHVLHLSKYPCKSVGCQIEQPIGVFRGSGWEQRTCSFLSATTSRI